MKARKIRNTRQGLGPFRAESGTVHVTLPPCKQPHNFTFHSFVISNRISSLLGGVLTLSQSHPSAISSGNLVETTEQHGPQGCSTGSSTAASKTDGAAIYRGL